MGGLSYHHSSLLPFSLVLLLPESVCWAHFLMEPLAGFLLWKGSGNCIKALIYGPQKYLPDMNETIRLRVCLGHLKGWMSKVWDHGGETSVQMPSWNPSRHSTGWGQTPSSSTLIPGCRHSSLKKRNEEWLPVACLKSFWYFLKLIIWHLPISGCLKEKKEEMDPTSCDDESHWIIISVPSLWNSKGKTPLVKLTKLVRSPNGVKLI